MFKNWLIARRIKLQNKIKHLEKQEEELGEKVVKLELKQIDLENDLQQKNVMMPLLQKAQCTNILEKNVSIQAKNF